MDEPEIDDSTVKFTDGSGPHTEKRVDAKTALTGPGDGSETKSDSAKSDETTVQPNGERNSANDAKSELERTVAFRSEALPSAMLDLIRSDSDHKIYVACMEVRERKFSFRCASEILHNGRSHLVPQLPSALQQSLTLPTSVRPYETTRKLFDSIVDLLRNHVVLPERECSLLAYWSIATWFSDFMPFFPSLAITGPAFSADLLLRTLAAVCRRPVALADVNPAVLRTLPLGELSPTLLIREPQMSKRLAALLDASNQPGYLIGSGNALQELYCAKCIYLGEHATSQLLKPNSIHIHVGGQLRRLLPPSPTDEVVRSFQDGLLLYRFHWHDAVASSKVRVPVFQFRPEVSAIAQSLAAPIVDDPELQRGIISLLQERDEQSRVDRASGQDGMVLRAVLWHCHQPDIQQVFVREIAATLNQLYGDEGESLKISSETVGHVLKSLGLYTRRLGNGGRGLMLDKGMQARVHELGQANEVLPGGSEVPACGYCHKLQVVQTQDVV